MRIEKAPAGEQLQLEGSVIQHEHVGRGHNYNYYILL